MELQVVDPVSNATWVEAPLYGTIMGVERGQNSFTVWYVDSAVTQRAGVMLAIDIVTASVVLLINSYHF